jgi:DHA3 family macrolide efflux protein-like MFS transporter
LVDRWNRRLVMMLADGLSAAAAGALALLFAFDAVQVWHIYTLMFVRAACAAFHWPAMQASTTLMVPDQHLARIAGLNQALPGMGAVVAPPLGALLLEVLPMQGILGIDVVTALLAIAPLFFVKVPHPERTASAGQASRPSLLADLREAIRFLRGWRAILMVVGIAMLTNLLILPAVSLQPLLVTEHFGGDAFQLALLQSAFGVGMVTGGVTLSAWGGFKNRAVMGLLALALSGVGLAVVGMAPANAFLLALAAMFFTWFMQPISGGAIFTVLQSTVPADMQGRVFTLLQSAAAAMTPLGLAVAGPVAEVLSVQAWFLIAGLAMIVIGVGSLFVPDIVHIESRAQRAGAEAASTGDSTAAPATAQ